MQFIDYFKEQLHHRTMMPFAEFMHYALYAPFVGYYSAGRSPLGIHGDFITAPELSPLFGHTLANQLRPLLKGMAEPILFEFGAGSGRLCIDLLQALQRLNTLPKEYHILDVSAKLKEQQQTLIQQTIPELYPRVRWLTRWPDEAFEGIMIANEVLDAMPVHRFLKTEQGLFESMVQLDQFQQSCIEVFEPCKNPQLQSHIAQALEHDITPYASEVNLFLDDWLAQCYSALKSGALFIIDYGFPRHEYYHPDRNHGTLMCHINHQAHTDPFKNPGYEDITAHVDFTHVAETAYNAGFHVAGYTNQASFLLANDLLSLVNTPELLTHKNQQAIKQLTSPSEMGELFKVIALTKALDVPLNGFQLHDKRASL